MSRWKNYIWKIDGSKKKRTMKRFRFGSLGIWCVCNKQTKTISLWNCINGFALEVAASCRWQMLNTRRETTNWIINSSDRRSGRAQCTPFRCIFRMQFESKSCFFLLLFSVCVFFTVSICKFFFVCEFIFCPLSSSLSPSLTFPASSKFKSLSKSKMNFSFALLRPPKQDNKMEQKKNKNGEKRNEHRENGRREKKKYISIN